MNSQSTPNLRLISTDKVHCLVRQASNFFSVRPFWNNVDIQEFKHTCSYTKIEMYKLDCTPHELLYQENKWILNFRKDWHSQNCFARKSLTSLLWWMHDYFISYCLITHLLLQCTVSILAEQQNPHKRDPKHLRTSHQDITEKEEKQSTQEQ